MSQRVKFEQKSDRCVAAVIKKSRVTWQGKPVQVFEGVRAVREADGWRVDFCPRVSGTWLPWEPIDRVSYPDQLAAPRRIRAYANSPAER